MRKVMALLLGANALLSAGQWDIPTSILFDAPNAEHRAMLGLGAPLESGDGASVGAIRYQLSTHSLAVGTNALLLDLTPTPLAYTPGMAISFVPTEVNTGATTVQINGLATVPLHKHGAYELDSADLRPGLAAQAVFNGAAFQLISQTYTGCPVGMVQVTRDVCVEAIASASAVFFGANSACMSKGMRLCTFGEWYQGCSRAALLGSVTAFEWVDHAANNTSEAKTMGWNINTQQADCKAGSHDPTPTVHRYRCCYDR
jgi:hypothetical protein